MPHDDTSAATATLIPVLMAGGQGQRLWPLSRTTRPKQFLRLGQPRSLLAATLTRVGQLPGAAEALIIAGEGERFLVAECLRASGSPGGGVVLEPAGRNTAAAAAIAALRAEAEQAADALLLLAPTDHHIGDEDAFVRDIIAATPAARAGHIVVFGVPPSRADAGYGYLQRGDPLPGGGHALRRFIEKPDAQRAQRLLDSGDYSWNSGMFLLRADVALAELERWVPETLRHCRAAWQLAISDAGFVRLDAEHFARCEPVSLDCAVMERTDQGAVFPLRCGWNDIGSWTSLRDMAAQDSDGNATVGDVLALDSLDCYLHSESRLLATLGLRGICVVETDDAVLVADLAHSQQIKTLIGALARAGRSELDAHATVHRPWGSYQSLLRGNGHQVKRICVLPGGMLSLQRHRQRSEHWTVVRGVATVTNGDRTFTLQPSETTSIAVGAVHRLANEGDGDLEIIEIQFGGYLGEDDIERLEDRYGRDSPATRDGESTA